MRALTTGSGTLVQTYQTDAFGNVTSSQWTVSQPFGYTGQQVDGNGLVYLRARYYDPASGRFLSRDVGGDDGANLTARDRCAYAQDNPVASTDPSGRCQRTAAPRPGSRCIMGNIREQGNGGRAMVTVQSPPAQRMILHHVSWETYQRLLQDFANSSAPRLTYDKGTLEIITPLPEHEEYGRFFEFVLMAVEEATGTKIYSFGSTTFSRDDLEEGFEPDACFYIQNGSRVRGKDRLDLLVDPPPDLVIEIDITHPSLPKLPIYAQIGVPEVWRYVDGAIEILLLDGKRYIPAPSSRALPVVTARVLTRLVRASRGLSQVERLRLAREGVGAPGTPND